MFNQTLFYLGVSGGLEDFFKSIQTQAYWALGIAALLFIVISISQQSIVGLVLSICIPLLLAVGITLMAHLQEIGEAITNVIIKFTGTGAVTATIHSSILLDFFQKLF